VKANKQQVERALKHPSADIRFILLYGPDEAGSRALAKTLSAAMGKEAERIDISGSELKADPARLADEAASISLFGGARYVWVEPAGDEAMEAASALIEAPVAGNPVVMVAGALKPASKLLKLALAAPCAMAFASYVPDGRDADKLVMDMGREQGLEMRPDVARRIADAAGGNRGIIAQELSKYAAFADAAPERPQHLDHDAVDAVGAASEEGDLSRMVDSVSGGDAAGASGGARPAVERGHRRHSADPGGASADDPACKSASRGRARKQRRHRHGVTRQGIVLEGKACDRAASLAAGARRLPPRRSGGC
jgi:DNA polymerase-3 subunit delta